MIIMIIIIIIILICSNTNNNKNAYGAAVELLGAPPARAEVPARQEEDGLIIIITINIENTVCLLLFIAYYDISYHINIYHSIV